jgi:hypothetical protein
MRHRLATGRNDLIDYGRRIRGFSGRVGEIVDDNLCAAFCEGEGMTASKALTGTSDYGHLTIKSDIHFSTSLNFPDFLADNH